MKTMAVMTSIIGISLLWTDPRGGRFIITSCFRNGFYRADKRGAVALLDPISLLQSVEGAKRCRFFLDCYADLDLCIRSASEPAEEGREVLATLAA